MWHPGVIGVCMSYMLYAYVYQRSFQFINIHVQGGFIWESRLPRSRGDRQLNTRSFPPRDTCTVHGCDFLPCSSFDPSYSSPIRSCKSVGNIEVYCHIVFGRFYLGVTIYWICVQSQPTTVYSPHTPLLRSSIPGLTVCVTVSTNTIKYASYRRKRWARGQGAMAALLSWDNPDLWFHDQSEQEVWLVTEWLRHALEMECFWASPVLGGNLALYEDQSPQSIPTGA